MNIPQQLLPDSTTCARRFLRYCACACMSGVQNMGAAVWRMWASWSAGSVGEVVRLVQLEQQVVGDVERGEADSHSDRPLQPVHAQAFVQSTHDPFLGHNSTHGPQNSGVRPARDASRLHAPTYHIQGVRGRLSDQACAGTKSQALVWVRLESLCFLYIRKIRQIRVWRQPDNNLKSVGAYLCAAFWGFHMWKMWSQRKGWPPEWWVQTPCKASSHLPLGRSVQKHAWCCCTCP